MRSAAGQPAQLLGKPPDSVSSLRPTGDGWCTTRSTPCSCCCSSATSQIRAGAQDPQLPLSLGELVAREVQERQDPLAAGLVQGLIPYGRAHTSHPPSSPDFLNLSLLVPP
ncbi:gas vesicle protein [Streptomyces zaomyceticus]